MRAIADEGEPEIFSRDWAIILEICIQVSTCLILSV